jgi:LuxR family transcriptional regulator, activator of tox operons
MLEEVGSPVFAFMQVVALHSRNSTASQLYPYLSKLIQTVGTSRFQAALAIAGHEVFGCEHVTAFAFENASPPRALTLSGSFRESQFQRAAARYSQLHWRLDPTNFFRARPLNRDHHYVAFLSEHEVTDSQYRQDCYVQTGIAHRMSVIRSHQDEVIKLSFHRTRSAGAFRPAEMADLLDHVDLLIDLVCRHALSSQQDPVALHSIDQYVRALERLNAGLTSREAQVCAGIVSGLHSAEIGTSLGVSINTVRTLRRRAYARLCVSSQNELLRLILR